MRNEKNLWESGNPIIPEISRADTRDTPGVQINSLLLISNIGDLID